MVLDQRDRNLQRKIITKTKEPFHNGSQTEDKWIIYVLERIKRRESVLLTKPKVHFIFIRNIDFLLYFKDFHEMLDYLTFVSLRSHFAETNLISLSLFQFADFVCKLRRL